MQRHFQHISVEDAKFLMSEETVQLMDIRDPATHEQSHIQGSIRVDNQNLKEFLDQADREVPLIVYCYHGNASQGAAEFMGQQGFERVYSLDGGFKRWHDLSQMDKSG